MEIIAGFILLLSFAAAALVRRAGTGVALAIGSLPALLVAAADPGSLGNPLSWLYLFAIWLPFVIAALVGAWLGKLSSGRFRRARR